MRLDGVEERFCYKPAGFAIGYGLRHSGLYQQYHDDMRAQRSEALISEEPTLALAAACAEAMGLFEDCAEVCIWREVCGKLPEKLLIEYRNIIPGIAAHIRAHGGELLKEMYFSKIIPVVVAMDAGEMEIAGRLCESALRETVEKYAHMIG